MAAGFREKIQLNVSDGTVMQAHVAGPEHPPATRGIIVLQEAFGVNSHIRNVTDRFAHEGYTAIAPELFHRTGPGFEGSYTDFASVLPHYQAVTEPGLEADLAAAYGWLMSRGVKQVASVGFCLGGRVSFFANAVLPLQAAVSYYGGGIAPGLLPRAASQHAPILLYWGGLDKHISPDHVKSVADALRAAGKDFVNVEFSQADHGFNCDDRASYNPAAAQESWTLTLAFLKKHLS
jgi:carboxymethylenebutenolidase